MKYSVYVIFMSLLLTSIGCKNQPSEPKSEVTAPISKTEIITRSYSVKLENGEPLKDTMIMMQSMIVNQDDQDLANIFYNPDGTVSWRDEYIYNDQGLKVGSKYFENGRQTVRYEYDVDAKGRRVGYRALEIESDTLLYDGASKYENNGRLRKDGYINKDGVFKWNYEYEFDQDGNELSFSYINLQNDERFPTVYQYTKVNADGQWIERTLVEDGIVTGIETRAFKTVDQ